MIDFSKYDNTIQDLADKILTFRVKAVNNTISYTNQLLTIGQNIQDDTLLGFAYYYAAEAYFIINDHTNFFKYLTLGLKHQERASLNALLARSYNMLGVDSINHGNIPSSLDYYLTALAYCKKSVELTYEMGLIYTNIGHLYALLKDDENALQYFNYGLEYFNQNKGNPFYRANILQLNVAMGHCHIRLGNILAAQNCGQKIENVYPSNWKDQLSDISCLCFQAKLCHLIGNFEKRDKHIEETLKHLCTISSLLDIYAELFDFCEFLIEIKKFDHVWKFLKHLSVLISETTITNLLREITRLKAQYFSAIGNNACYLQMCHEYFQLSQKYEKEKSDMLSTVIELRFSLEKAKERQEFIEQENELLHEKSERDSLTGLPNRYRLNDYSETAFERAYKNQTSLAVEILDVDYFKQYNDTYGHQYGDACLKSISRLLLDLLAEGIFCARYGGDEFIIIYENMTDEEILSIAETLKKDVLNLKIRNRHSQISPYVTISQGIRNSIPNGLNKLWDYMFTADNALYRVKKNSKNGICLLHHTRTALPEGPTL